MLITVTVTSQTLDTILTVGQKTISKRTINSDNYIEYHKILLQNLGAQDIYIEFGQAATLTGGVKIPQNATFEFNDFQFKDCNLISDTVDNIDVRILFN